MCTRLIGHWMPHIFMCERSGDNLIKTFCPRKQNDMVLCGEVLGHFPIAMECFEHKKISSFQSPIWHFHDLHFGLVCRLGQSVWKHTKRVPQVTVQTYFSRKIIEEEHGLIMWSVLFLDIALGLSAYYPQQLKSPSSGKDLVVPGSQEHYCKYLDFHLPLV